MIKTVACRICGQVHLEPVLSQGQIAECARCGGRLRQKTPGHFHLTAAFLVCAMMLYLPANLFPFLTMNLYGRITESTVISGVEQLYQGGSYFVAIAIFLASVLVPILKILGLLFLVISTRFHWPRLRRFRLRVYRTIDMLGKWAMLDVFALAILVSLLKGQNLAHVIPGQGLLPFCLVIVFTLLASFSFDPDSIWEDEHESA